MKGLVALVQNPALTHWKESRNHPCSTSGGKCRYQRVRLRRCGAARAGADPTWGHREECQRGDRQEKTWSIWAGMSPRSIRTLLLDLRAGRGTEAANRRCREIAAASQLVILTQRIARTFGDARRRRHQSEVAFLLGKDTQMFFPEILDWAPKGSESQCLNPPATPKRKKAAKRPGTRITRVPSETSGQYATLVLSKLTGSHLPGERRP